LLSKEFMIEVLKKTCGGSCLTDPDNCDCFAPPTQEMLDDCGLELEDWAIFDTKEECPHYDAEAWAYSDDENKEDLTMPESVFELFFNSKPINKDFNDMSNKEPKKEETPKDVQSVYLLFTSYGIKIGKSKTPITRAKVIGTKLPFKVNKIKSYPVEDMTKTELFLHGEYRNYRLNGEWFNLSLKQVEEIDTYLNKIKC